ADRGAAGDARDRRCPRRATQGDRPGLNALKAAGGVAIIVAPFTAVLSLGRPVCSLSLCDCRSGDLSIGRQEWRAEAVLVDLDGREPGGTYHRREVALAGAPLEDPCPRPPDAVPDLDV